MRWCSDCRRQIVRRASVWARSFALGLSLLLGFWIAYAIQPSTRFLIGWLALLAAAYLIIAQIVRRIAFEIIRARGVSPPET